MKRQTALEIEKFVSFLPLAAREWVGRTDDIVFIVAESETLPDGIEEGKDGQMWKKYKIGNHRTICVQRKEGTVSTQRFISALIVNGILRIARTQTSLRLISRLMNGALSEAR